MSDQITKPRGTLAICLLLAVITFLTYWPVLQSGFVNYDDPQYVTKNPAVLAGLTSKGIVWAFTARHSDNWHPLTWISHMTDSEIFGTEPAGHHATNLLLHIANSVLVFWLLLRLTGAKWRSAFVAALFALHPLHVESVAWIAERKDVLSTFFWALTLLAYLRYVEQPGTKRYLQLLLLFALGLMAKPMLVTLPCLLLLLDFWPLRRGPARLRFLGRELVLLDPAERPDVAPIPLERLIQEKLPLFALTLLSCLVTLWAQTKAVASLQHIPFEYRVANSILSYARYMWKMVWPADLVVQYPLIHALSAWQWGIAAAAILIVSFLALCKARPYPWFLTGWFWFLGTLVPVIGLVQVGSQSLADRYTYVPLIGLFIILAWGGYEIVTRLHLKSALAGIVAVLLIAVCIPLTYRQATYWKDSERLFTHALEHTGNNYTVEVNLAITYFEKGQFDTAREHYLRATNIEPASALAHRNLGQTLAKMGSNDDAIASFQLALHYNPKLPSTRFALAAVLNDLDRFAEAAEQLEIELQFPADRWSLSETHGLMGQVLLKQRKMGEALPHLVEALRLDPDNASAHLYLANIQNQSGHTLEAIQNYRDALRLDPAQPEALNNLAWILATHPDPVIRNGEEAVQLAGKACQLTAYRIPFVIGTLGAAYAEAGHFEEAAAAARQAYLLADRLGNTETAKRNLQLEELYRSGRAFHETAPPTP